MRKSLLSKAEKTKITEAIGLELLAANTYRYMSNELKDLGYFGAAKFFQNEASEETEHYQIWADFVNDMNDCADVPAIPAAEGAEDLKGIFKAYFDREKNLLDFYSDWYMSCDNAAIHEQLIFFVNKQRTSVGEAGDFLATLEQCGDDKGALLLFDKQF